MEYGGGLLRFLAPTRSALSVLVVESLAYLPKLRNGIGAKIVVKRQDPSFVIGFF